MRRINYSGKLELIFKRDANLNSWSLRQNVRDGYLGLAYLGIRRISCILLNLTQLLNNNPKIMLNFK